MTKKQLDEISKKTLGSYIKKANVNYGTHAMKIQQIRGTKDRLYRTVNAFSPDDLPRDAENHLNAGINKAHSNLSKKEDKHTRKVINRERGISKATDRLTREETLDEISKDTLKNYIKKAAVDLRAREYKDGITTASDGYADRKARTHAYKKIAKRQKGLNQAVDKLAEDQLDELSKETLAAYIKRANLKGRDTNQAKGRFDKGQYLNMPHPDPEKDKFLQKHKRDSRNREKGINRAVDRLVKEDLDLQESLADLTNNIIFGSAGDAKQIFDDIAKGKIGDLIQAKREEVAAQLFADLKKTEKPEVQEEDADEDIELSDEDIEFLNSLSEEEIQDLFADIDLEEDSEQLDEISDKEVSKYLKHATTYKSFAKTNADSKERTAGNMERRKFWKNQVKKRTKGIALATKKLSKGPLKESGEQLDELSKKTLGNYIKKASDAKSGAMAGIVAGDHDSKKQFLNRRKGIIRAVDKLVKEDELKEGAYADLQRKRKKEAKALEKNTDTSKAEALGLEAFQSGKKRVPAQHKEFVDHLATVTKGKPIGHSLPHLTAWNKGWDKGNLKEGNVKESEEVNEISKSTLERYIQKAKKSADNHYNKADPEYHRDGEYHYKKLTQRQYGIAQAKHKLDKAKK